MVLGLVVKITAVLVIAIAALFYRERVMPSNYDENPEYIQEGRKCLAELMSQVKNEQLKGFSTFETCVCNYKIKGNTTPNFDFYYAQIHHARGMYLGSRAFRTTVSNPNDNNKTEIQIQLRCSGIIGYISKIRGFI